MATTGSTWLRGMAIAVGVVTAGCGPQGDMPGGDVRVADDIVCQRCTIVLDSVVTLMAPADTADGFPIAVRIDSLGRYWVLRREALPALFSQTGEYLTLVGRLGQGPGEFVWPSDVIAIARDSVVVIDSRSRRATVLDSAQNAIRTLRLPIAIANPVALHWPDSVLVSGSNPLQAGHGPLFRLSFGDREAQVRESMGPEELPDEMLVLWRHHIAPRRDGHFWAAWESAYDLTEWRSDGVLIRRLERRPPWFPGVANAFSHDWRNQPPQSYVAGIDEDAKGVLWVYLLTAAPTWKDVVDGIPAGIAEYDPRRLDLERMMQLTIEAIDPERPGVLGRRVVSGYPVGTVPGVGFALYLVDEVEGTGQVRVVRASLKRP